MRGLAAYSGASREHRLIGSILAADWSLRASRVWDSSLFTGINWDLIPALAAQLKVRPMLAVALREAGWPGVPASVRARVEAAEIQCTRKTLVLLSLLAGVTDRAQSRGIRVLALKGPALSRKLYDDPIIRESFDLDILVHPNDVTAMAEVLAAEGILPDFEGPALSPLQTARLRHYNKHDAFRDRVSGTVVECHYSLDHNPWRLHIGFDELWNRHQTVAVAGQRIAIPGDSDLIQFLCAHAARHIWDRWKWLGDFAALCRLFSGKEMAEHREFACGLGNSLIFDASFLLTAAVTGIQLPNELAQRVCENRAASAAAHRSLSLLLNGRGTNCAPSHAYLLRQIVERLRLKPSLRCVTFEAVVLAHRQEDWQAYRLPDSMVWAHYPIRLLSLVARVLGRDGEPKTSGPG